ncbi:MAG: Rrf2 family transcriptional regulator, partial [Prosthecobacter sp.]|nr:Rrf2 family transcriptional regulator [Prosthecobacter sp.]
RGGGIQLARPPEDIRIGKLVRETEDQPVMVECFDAASNTCRLNGSCRLKGALVKAMRAFYDSLDEHTLRDFVSGPQRNRMIKTLLPPPDAG